MDGPAKAPRARRRDGLRRRRTWVGLGFAASLSALAGMTDAIGLLLAGDFVSFMSGNTTRLAVALGGGEWGRAAELALIVGVFIAGNATGVVFASLTGRRHELLLGLVTATLSSAALLAVWPSFATTLAIVFSMGIVNVAVERVEGRPLGVTYVTGALSRFGRGLGQRFLGQRPGSWWVELVPWLGMIGGALVGAIAALGFGTAAILLPAAVAASLTAVSAYIPSRWRQHYFVSPHPGPR